MFVDLDLIREFYGDEVAIYHAWMNHLFKWLIVPALLAITVSVCDHFLFTVEKSPLNAIYSLIMVFWGTAQVVNWRRNCRGLDVLWDDYTLKRDGDTVRKEFKGTITINTVTDKPDTTFKFSQRLPFYILSACICVPCLMFCIFVIICFLNMTGAIRPENHGGIFNIPLLSSMADPGAIFDPESNMNILAGIIQAVVTTIMNTVFQKIAKWTTHLENHKSQHKYNHSVFIKRFIFEFTDCHLYLLYIGIY